MKSKSIALLTLRSAPTTEGLRESVQNLQARKQESEERIRVLRSGSIKPVSKEEKEAAEKEWRRWKRAREARKRGFLDLEGMLLDSGVMNKQELWVCISTRWDIFVWLSVGDRPREKRLGWLN